MPRRYDDDDDDDDDFDVGRRSRRGRSSEAGSRLVGPAIAIMVCAILDIVVQCIGLPINIYTWTQHPRGIQPENIGNIVGILIRVAIQGFIIFGCVQMKGRSMYGVALTAAILSVIPCCSSCIILGIPFGIWALIVMMDPDVKSSFYS